MPAERAADDPVDPTDLELRSRIPPNAHGTRLIDYLAARFRYHTVATWRAEIGAGRVELDGRTASADAVLRAGAALCYRKQHREPPIDRDVRVLHRDPALLVVEKPAHLPVHGDGAFVRHTLIHLLRHELGHPEARIVHRLDRETSGLLVVARTDAARAALERQFVAGSVGKSYLAVVHGAVERDFVCDAPIGRATTSSITLRRAAAANARDPKPASTRFTVLERGRDRTLLGCEPATGRTHQIRVHLEHVGHPLLGDKLYGRTDAEYLAFVARVKAGGDPREVPPGEPPRQLLHAAALAFRHPDDERALRFESAAPAEFGAWLARSSQGDSARPTGQGQQG